MKWRGRPCWRRLPFGPREGLSDRHLHQSEHSPYAFGYARTALKCGLQALGVGRGDTLLLPELICEVVLHPLRELKVKPRYYAVSPNLEPIWSEIERQLDATVRGIVMVHYFGQPQECRRFQEFCGAHELLLIEDNAHGYAAEYDGYGLGMLGDIGICSPRKSVPILNGAYLHLRSGIRPSAVHFPPQPVRFRASPIVAQLGAQVQGLLPFLTTWKMRRQGYTSQDSLEPMLPHWSMYRATHEFLARQEPHVHRSRRRQVYRVWKDWSEGQGLIPVFSALRPGASPLAFPAYVRSAQEWNKWLQWGYRNRVEVFSWPTLPRELVRHGSRVLEQWQRMVCFPIHAEMHPEELEDTLSKISRYPRSH